MSARRRRARKSGQLGKILTWSGLVLITLFLVAGVLGYRWVRVFLRSDDFRLLLGREAGNVLGAQTEFTPFVWDGWSARTESLQAAGEGKLQSLEAEGLEGRVDVGAVWDGIYRLEDLAIRRINARVDLRKKAGEAGEADPGARAAEKSPKKHGSSFWDRFLPSRFEMTGLQIASLGGQALSESGEWNWSGSAMEIKPGSSPEAYDIRLTGGKIDTPLELLPEVRLAGASGRLSGGRFYLTDARLEALKRASLELSGEFQLAERGWTLKGDLVGADCAELVTEDWKRRLLGELGTRFRAEKSGGGEVVLSGEAELQRGVLTALPILDKIAAYTG
ncbi:MAG: hypothetical protein ACQKBY_06545, partial [Verrucomicrobiales bacterium]